MSLIEGIGDEVTVFFVLLTFLCILVIAWFSTNIRDIPFFSLIIIELSHRRGRQPVQTQENQNETLNVNAGALTDGIDSVETEVSDSTQDNSSDENEKQRNTFETPEGVTEQSGNKRSAKADDVKDDSTTKPKEVVVASDIETDGVESNDNPIIPQSSVDSNLTETELRKRRVDFFVNKTIVSSSETVKHDDVWSNEKPGKDSRTCHNEIVSDSDSSNHGNSTSQGDRTGHGSLEKTNVDVLSCQQRDNLQNVGPSDNENLNQERVAPSGDSSQRTGQTTSPRLAVPTDTQSQNEEDQIRIRLKYLNDSQRQVTAHPKQTIGQFRRDNFASELENNKLVRFIFNGQDLRNDANTLQAYNIVDNSVVHCLITQVDRRGNQSARQEADDGFDIGNLMLPVFGFIICVVWYLRFEYRQFFSGTSTISLIGITFLYIAAILASWENHRRGHAHEHVE